MAFNLVNMDNLGYMVTSDRRSDVSHNLNNKISRGCSVPNVTLLTQYRGETSAFAKMPDMFSFIR